MRMEKIEKKKKRKKKPWMKRFKKLNWKKRKIITKYKLNKYN